MNPLTPALLTCLALLWPSSALAESPPATGSDEASETESVEAAPSESAPTVEEEPAAAQEPVEEPTPDAESANEGSEEVEVQEESGGKLGVDNGGDFPNSGDVLGPGVFQLEVNYNFESAGSPATQTHGLPTLIRIGLFKGFELRVGGEVFTLVDTGTQTSSGTGPYNLGFKYSFFSGGEDSYWKPVALGVQLQADFPLGTEGFDGDVVQPSATVNVDYSFPIGILIALNLGIEVPYDAAEDSFYVTSSFQWSVGYNIIDEIGLYVHGLIQGPATPSGEGVDLRLGGAFMGYLSDWGALFGSVTSGLTDASSGLVISGGFALRY